MELTQEQIDIINSTGNIKINAVAGSGKTTTIIEYARTRPTGSKILYLAFNKSVKIDAAKKFSSKGLHNVKVETAHSLAFQHIVQHSNYKVRPQEYKIYELVEMLDIRMPGEKLLAYIIANHVNKFVAYFCNSNVQKVQDINYREVVTDAKAKDLVDQYYSLIELKTRQLLAKMNDAKIDITHDFYLKKFQLSNPALHYDYLLFDEGQDASPAMLDVFFKQKAVKVIVGDTHQQIYGWRFAVNSLEQADFKTFYLTKSFRFCDEIARLAMEVLKWKKNINEEAKVIEIVGVGNSIETKVKAILARTNLGLLLKAIEYITEKDNIKQIYFEGNIASYTYADNGTSLYDVLNLFNKKQRLIKDKLIKTMHNFAELEEYIEKTEDRQLGMLVEIVKDYGDDIPEIIKTLKSKHVDKDEKEKAEIIFSTIHRCKGMEYDTVQLVADFITEEDLKKSNAPVAKIIEEINLLYVAITRTKNTINIPEKLLPKDFVCKTKIHKLHDVKEEAAKTVLLKQSNSPVTDYKDKTYSIEAAREKNADAYMPWTIALDDELAVMYCEGISVKDMAKHFGRSKSAINSRMKKLEIKEKYG